MMRFLSVGELAEFCGVCIKTLHRWEAAGLLSPAYRTKGGHRRYSVAQANALCGISTEDCIKTSVLYARVSSADQKDDLTRQMARLKDYAATQGLTNTVALSDIGSGMNFNKKGLLALLKLLFTGTVGKLLVTHKDRLMRFGFGLIERVCGYLNVEILVIDTATNAEAADFTTQLTQDLVEIITVFSAKLYGKRSANNRKNLGPEIKQCATLTT